MKRSRFTEQEIVAILQERGTGVKTADLCRKHGICEATFYAWKAKFGGLDVAEATWLRTLEDENRKLKKMLAESHARLAALKEFLANKLHEFLAKKW